MGRYLEPGHVYVDGQTITGPSLTEHVGDAILKTTAISEQLLKDPATLTDELLINDAGTFKKITLQTLKSIILLTLTSEELSPEVRIPVGSVLDFAGVDEPQGWLFCYGQEISRTDPFDRLFEAIGTVYGAGDGSSTFRVPDCRGRVAAGKDNMGGTSANRLVNTINGDNLGVAGGADRHFLQITEMPNHSHTFTDTYAASSFVGGSGLLASGVAYTVVPTTTSNTTTVTGGSGAHNNVQPTIVLNKIIRYL